MFKADMARIIETAEKDNYSTDLYTNILVLAPPEVKDCFTKFIYNEDNTISKNNILLANIDIAMKKELVKLDEEINELLS